VGSAEAAGRPRQAREWAHLNVREQVRAGDNTAAARIRPRP